MLFIAVYIFAIVLVLLKDKTNAVAFIGMSIGILFLIWLIIGITKNTQISHIQIKGPAWELAFGLLILIIWSFTPLRYFYLSMVDGITHLILVVWHSASLPNLAIGDKWSLGFILKRNLILFVLPFVFLKVRKNSLSSMGLTATDWKKNLRTGLILGVLWERTRNLIPRAFLHSGINGLNGLVSII